MSIRSVILTNIVLATICAGCAGPTTPEGRAQAAAFDKWLWDPQRMASSSALAGAAQESAVEANRSSGESQQTRQLREDLVEAERRNQILANRQPLPRPGCLFKIMAWF